MMRAREGFTLIELVVVLAIMMLAAAVVLPALSRAPAGTTVQSVIESARDAAARRGEIVYLRIGSSGTWHMEGGGSPLESDDASGRITPLAAAPITLLVAPSGSCAFDVPSSAAAQALSLDPLSCTLSVRAPAVTASSS